MRFMGMKLLSHLTKLLHLMTLPSQQFCLCGTLFNVHDTLMKQTLRLALLALLSVRVSWPSFQHIHILETTHKSFLGMRNSLYSYETLINSLFINRVSHQHIYCVWNSNETPLRLASSTRVPRQQLFHELTKRFRDHLVELVQAPPIVLLFFSTKMSKWKQLHPMKSIDHVD